MGTGTEAQGAVVHPWAQSGQGRGWGGRGFGCGRTQRRCAGVVVAAGAGGGEMGEDLLDDLGSLDARDDTQRSATHPTVFDVDVEDSIEAPHPAHGRTTRPMGLAGGLLGRVGDNAAAMLEVRGEHAVVSGEMGAGAWHEGGEAGDEVDGVEHDMGRSVTEGVLEPIHDLCAVIDREAFVRDSGALATERHQLLVLAGIALDAQESVFEAPALQGRLELFPRRSRTRGCRGRWPHW